MLIKRLFVSFIFIIIVLFFYYYTNDEKKTYEAINYYDYIGDYNSDICRDILIIDKINLKKCMNDKDVNRDIEIIYDNNAIVLAGHSGSANNAYFRNLHKLNIGDEVIFYHKNIKNNYEVYDIKKKEKKEKLYFKDEDNILILVTCSEDNKAQLVYYLVKI